MRSASEVREELLARLNRYRRAAGIVTVRSDATLDRAAQQFAHHMADTNRLDHRADGCTAAQRARSAGYPDEASVWENIACCGGAQAIPLRVVCDCVWTGWVNSPPHAANLRAPPARAVGIGLARSTRSGRWYAAMLLAEGMSR